MKALECKQAKYSKFSKSRAHNSRSYCPILPIIELSRDIVAIYIVSKFDHDLLRAVDARV